MGYIDFCSVLISTENATSVRLSMDNTCFQVAYEGAHTCIILRFSGLWTLSPLLEVKQRKERHQRAADIEDDEDDSKNGSDFCFLIGHSYGCALVMCQNNICLFPAIST